MGDYVALEVNMRPAGGYTPDMINFANSVDSYAIWADMVTKGENTQYMGHEHYYCVYAARRDGKNYLNSHEDVLNRYGSRIVMCDRMPDALALDMGNQMYTALLHAEQEKDEFIAFVQTLA